MAPDLACELPSGIGHLGWTGSEGSLETEGVYSVWGQTTKPAVCSLAFGCLGACMRSALWVRL